MTSIKELEEFLNKFPQTITVDGKEYEFALQRTIGEPWPKYKYVAQYWNLNKKDKDMFLPANVIVEEDGRKWYEYAISMGGSLEEVLIDLMRRIKNYI